MVKVKLFANFREVAGEKEVDIKANNIKDLISRLVSKYPAMEELVNTEEYLHIMLNGEYIHSEKYENTELKEKDVVSIFPPVSGG